MKKLIDLIRMFLPEGDFETYTPEKFDMLGWWFCILIAAFLCIVGHYTRSPLAFFAAGYAFRSAVKPGIDAPPRTSEKK